jgi:hypothetical protein
MLSSSHLNQEPVTLALAARLLPPFAHWGESNTRRCAFPCQRPKCETGNRAKSMPYSYRTKVLVGKRTGGNEVINLRRPKTERPPPLAFQKLVETSLFQGKMLGPWLRPFCGCRRLLRTGSGIPAGDHVGGAAGVDRAPLVKRMPVLASLWSCSNQSRRRSSPLSGVNSAPYCTVQEAA